MLVGRQVEVETPHPRAAAVLDARRIDGQRLESVEAAGKNLFLSFDGGLVVRSHLRMSGRWQVRARGAPVRGRPWLVLRSAGHEALLWNGPVLELSRAGRARRPLGPDILAEPPDLEAMVAGLRAEHPSRELGDALLDQRVVAGIGNIWRAEALWHARLSPSLRLAETTDDELDRALREAARLMRGSLENGGAERHVYRRAGRPCDRCGEVIRSRGQGDDNRTAYWCPGCQRGEETATA